MRIDAHHHFWKFDPSELDWITEDLTVLRKDYSPKDLQPILEAAGIQGTVLVEARGHIDETSRLLAYAEEADFVHGIVGWFPLIDPALDETLAAYVTSPKLKGARHAVSAEPDPEYMNREDFNRGVKALAERNLTFDLSFYPPQLESCLDFIDRHPNQIFILDHLAKPYIKAGEIEQWSRSLKALSKRPNAYSKLSGLATEADTDNWTLEDLRPYLETALECFGTERLMYGSDWPVCLLATSYERWIETFDDWISELSDSEQSLIMGETAAKAYRL